MPLKPGTEERYVTLLYRHFLGRDPEPDVMPQWLNALKYHGPLAVARAVGRSAEAKYRAVEGLFRDVLGRHGSPAEVLNWAQSKFSAQEVREEFLASEEFLGSVGEEEPPEPAVPAMPELPLPKV